MSKVIRTADLTILKTWLVGGQINAMGNHCECFNTFDEYADELKDDNGNYSDDKIKDAIFNLVADYNDNSCYLLQ